MAGRTDRRSSQRTYRNHHYRAFQLLRLRLRLLLLVALDKNAWHRFYSRRCSRKLLFICLRFIGISFAQDRQDDSHHDSKANHGQNSWHDGKRLENDFPFAFRVDKRTDHQEKDGKDEAHVSLNIRHFFGQEDLRKVWLVLRLNALYIFMRAEISVVLSFFVCVQPSNHKILGEKCSTMHSP